MTKKQALAATIGMFILLGLSALVVPKTEKEKVLYTGNVSRGTVRIGDAVFRVDVASTKEKRELGLSGRKTLAAGEGMLFVFDTPGRYPFWMKDMNFPLDILWIDEHQTIVHIAPNLVPETYPNAYTTEIDALYVLELPAGTVGTKGISVGEKVEFGEISSP